MNEVVPWNHNRDASLLNWRLNTIGCLYTAMGIVGVTVQDLRGLGGFRTELEFCCAGYRFEIVEESKTAPTGKQLRQWANALATYSTNWGQPSDAQIPLGADSGDES